MANLAHLLLSAFLLSAVTADPRCEDDWTLFQDEICIKAFNDKLVPYDEAQQYCESEWGAGLVIVKNQEMQEIVEDIFKDIYDYIWLGGRYNEKAAEFLWNDETPLTYSKWTAGYPKDTANEDACVDMRREDFRRSSIGAEGSWGHSSCEKKRNVVMCQKPSKWEFEDAVATILQMKKQAASDRKELVVVRTQLGEAQVKLDETATKLGETESNLGTTNAELEKVTEALTTTRSLLGATKIELGIVRDELEQANTEIARTTADLQVVNDKLAGTEGDLATTKNEVKDLQGQLEDTTDKLNLAVTELKAAKDNIVEMTGQLTETEQDLVEVQTQLAETTSKLTKTEGQVEENKLKLNETGDQLSGINGRLGDLSAQLEDTNGRIGDTNDQLEETKVNLTETNSYLQDSALLLAQTRTELSETQIKLDQTNIQLDNTTGKLSDTIADLGDVANQVADVSTAVVPVGSIYVEYYNQPSPHTLWPSFTWQDITNTYAGLFFRAYGGDSEEWGSTQGDCSPRITSMEHQERSAGGQYPNGITISENGWSEYGDAGENFPDENGQRWFEALRFYTEGCEVRPRNQAVRIWKRTN